MSKHERLQTVLRKLYFVEDAQRSVKEIRKQIERYEKRNLELVSEWPNGIPQWARNEKYNVDTKIRELKWTYTMTERPNTSAKNVVNPCL